MDKKLLLIMVIFLSICMLEAQEVPRNTHFIPHPNPPKISNTDRIRLAQVFKFVDELSEKIWKGWSAIDMPLLFINEKYEFLFKHPVPTYDFDLIGFDSTFNTTVYFRKRLLKANAFSTYPAVNDISTIAAGKAEKTEAKRSSAWVLMLMREHFHQFQYAFPEYNYNLRKLKIANAGSTETWKTNYPFPYDSPAVGERFSSLCNALYEALKYSDKTEFKVKVEKFINERKKFRSLLSANDYKYFCFQVWQEGIPYYVEYQSALCIAKNSKPTDKFIKLYDFTNFDKEAKRLKKEIVESLKTNSLTKSKRTAFFSYGASEALLLDLIKPEWKKNYFEKWFTLENNFE